MSEQQVDSTTSTSSTAAAAAASSEETISAYFVFFSTLLAVVLVLSKLLHDHRKLASYIPEAGMILLVGMMAGFIVHVLYGEERFAQHVRGIDQMNDSQQYQQHYEYYGDDDQYSNNGNNNDNANDGDVDYQALVQNVLSFSPNAFFVALLPPIIFNSGYHLQRELFFRHLVPIGLLACLGTLVSTLVIAFFLKFITLVGWNDTNFVPTFTELLTFGALISATDPVSTLAVFQVKRVDPQLFYLVFGESVLNDAVGLVLFETFCKFVIRDNGAGKIAIGLMEFILGFAMDSIASPLLGWISALGAALVFKHVDFRNNKLLELSLFLLIMYFPFLVAEIFHLSGIVTILVTGIAARHYVEPNLSESTADIADVIFRLTAHLAETSIFLELGLSVFGVTGFFMWRFVLWSLLACLVARACHVYPIAYLFNQRLKQDKCCDIFNYSFREGVDGIMKMECGKATLIVDDTNNSNNNNGNGNSSATTSSNAVTKKSATRKALSGNAELTEHLNDFSNHHPMEQSDSNHSSTNSSTPESHQSSGSSSSPATEAAAAAAAKQQQHPPSICPTPSELSLTPVPKRDLKIQPKTAHMLWFSGLRGAVAYACVRSFPDTFAHQREFVSTTMMIVLITVFFMGGATEIVLNWLDIEMNVNEDQFMEAWRQSEQAPAPGFWTWFDKRFVQRHVIRDYDVSTVGNLNVATSGPIQAKGSSGDLSDGNSRLANSARMEDRNEVSKSTKSVVSQLVEPAHDLEMTESTHYDTLHEMGIPEPQGRRKTSLFDYGKSD